MSPGICGAAVSAASRGLKDSVQAGRSLHNACSTMELRVGGGSRISYLGGWGPLFLDRNEIVSCAQCLHLCVISSDVHHIPVVHCSDSQKRGHHQEMYSISTRRTSWRAPWVAVRPGGWQRRCSNGV